MLTMDVVQHRNRRRNREQQSCDSCEQKQLSPAHSNQTFNKKQSGSGANCVCPRVAKAHATMSERLGELENRSDQDDCQPQAKPQSPPLRLTCSRNRGQHQEGQRRKRGTMREVERCEEDSAVPGDGHQNPDRDQQTADKQRAESTTCRRRATRPRLNRLAHSPDRKHKTP